MSSETLRLSCVAHICLVFSLAYGLSSLQAQQRVSNDLNGICIASLDGVSGMTSAIFSTPARSRADAERAWAAYAVQQNAGQPVKGSRCIWSTTPIDPAKVNITSQNGGKVTQTNWKYDAPLSATQAVITPVVTPTTGTAATRNAGAGTSQAAALSPTPGSMATPTNAAGVSATPTGSASATGAASIGQSMQQSMQDAKGAATTAVNGTVNAVTTTTVQMVTGGLQSLQTSFVNRLTRKKQDPLAPQNAALQSGATSAAPPVIPAGSEAGSSTPAASVTQNVAQSYVPVLSGGKPGGAAGQPSPGGMSFTFCHLVASGKEYISDIFPTMSSDSNLAGAAFWQAIGAQYHLSNVPYRNNVACVQSATEAEAITAMQALKSTGSQRGVTAGQEIDTNWTHSGN